jgi:Glycosyl transferase family 2
VLDSREHPLTEFFDGLRQTRREKRAPTGTNRRTALLTIVRDEPVFLPIWLRYYSRYFAADDIHVLDHGTVDGSTDGSGFVRIPVEHGTVDNTWMVERMQAEQRRLLESYDNVLAVDVDELVTPDPNWGTLDEYLAGFTEDFVNCLGYEVIHLRDREPPIRLDRPVLEQRGYWFAADGYDKPSLASVPMEWTPGLHARADGRLNLDPDLFLVHLHRMDYEICLQRHGRWTRWDWNKGDLEGGRGTHNRITDPEEFDRWFYTEGCFEAHRGLVIERIPERWRGSGI